MNQRAEPPSWLPEGARPSTGTGADLRTPDEAEAVPADTPEAAGYVFSGETGYPNGQDTALGHQAAGPGYGYGDDRPEDATGVVPPYPAQASEAGSEPATMAEQPLSGQGTVAPPGPAANRTAAYAAPPRGRYQAGGGVAPASAGPASRPGAGGAAQARRADLVVARLEPWSVMKFSFLMSLVAWVVLFVAVAFLYFVLSSLGVFTSLQHTLGSVTSSSGSSGVNLSHWFSASRILGYTMLLGAINIVLITALSTVGAMIYNLVTHLGGGIEVTLRESD